MALEEESLDAFALHPRPGYRPWSRTLQNKFGTARFPIIPKRYYLALTNTTPAMHTLICPLLLVASTAIGSVPEGFHVVVNTTDRVVVNFICSNDAAEPGQALVFGSELRSKGGFNWHVVGGTAPYRVISNNMNSSTGGCITVMDAQGRTATGCGTIGVRTEIARVDCQGELQQDPNIYRPAPTDTVSFDHPVDTAKPDPLGPDRTHVGPDSHGEDPVDPPTPGPIDDYRPPVKGPSTDGPTPPVGPVVPVKDPVHTPRPNDKPRPVHQPSPVRNPGLVSPPVQRSPTAPAPRPTTPVAPSVPAGAKSNM